MGDAIILTVGVQAQQAETYPTYNILGYISRK